MIEKKVPVIAPLGLDKDNRVFNINADTAAGAIAKKLNARRLIIMSDVEAGNALVKIMIYFMGACAAGVVVGGNI